MSTIAKTAATLFAAATLAIGFAPGASAAATETAPTSLELTTASTAQQGNCHYHRDHDGDSYKHCGDHGYKKDKHYDKHDNDSGYGGKNHDSGYGGKNHDSGYGGKNHDGGGWR